PGWCAAPPRSRSPPPGSARPRPGPARQRPGPPAPQRPAPARRRPPRPGSPQGPAGPPPAPPRARSCPPAGPAPGAPAAHPCSAAPAAGRCSCPYCPRPGGGTPSRQGPYDPAVRTRPEEEPLAVVPRPAATVALLRDGRNGLEAYLQLRPLGMGLPGGVGVLPGGGVDDADGNA